MTKTKLELRAPLFVPGDMPERFGKAMQSAADAVILDLEDAVALGAKDRARGAVKDYLHSEKERQRRDSAALIGIRVNATTTGEFDLDAELLRSCVSQIDYIVLPMVSGSEDLDILAGGVAGEAGTLDVPVLALIESSAGVLNCPNIARHPRVGILAFGSADLSNELGIETTLDGNEFLFARSQLVLASAAARLPKPLDAPHMNVRDLDGLRESMSCARKLGMGGKLCIHPEQVGAVLETTTPSRQEYERARSIAQAFEESEAKGHSSIRLEDGTFIDYPIAAKARRVMELYER